MGAHIRLHEVHGKVVCVHKGVPNFVNLNSKDSLSQACLHSCKYCSLPVGCNFITHYSNFCRDSSKLRALLLRNLMCSEMSALPGASRGVFCLFCALVGTEG